MAGVVWGWSGVEMKGRYVGMLTADFLLPRGLTR
jgi:hypothetical protein